MERPPLSFAQGRRGSLQFDPLSGNGDQWGTGLSKLQEYGEEGGAAACRPGGKKPQRSRHLRRFNRSAETLCEQPDVVWFDREWSGLLTLYLQRRKNGSLANFNRAAAPVPGSYRLHPVWGAFTNLQAEADSHSVCRADFQRRQHSLQSSQLSDAPR